MEDPRALADAAHAVYAAARSHKRAADAHRKQAKNLMVSFGRLRALCAQHGIEIQLEDRDPQEGHSHG